MIKKVSIGEGLHTSVLSLSNPLKDGMKRMYTVVRSGSDMLVPKNHGDSFAMVTFQDGLVADRGVNGCQDDDLLIMVLDRIRDYRTSEYNCLELGEAERAIETALLWLGSMRKRIAKETKLSGEKA